MNCAPLPPLLTPNSSLDSEFDLNASYLENAILGIRRQQTPVSSFRAKREIFVIRGQAVDIRESKTRNLLIRRPSGIAIIYTPRRFYIFMRRTTISHF